MYANQVGIRTQISTADPCICPGDAVGPKGKQMIILQTKYLGKIGSSSF